MLTTVQRAILPKNRRILIVSDIHGHADGFRALLEQAEFSKEDILIILGDLVEKGPQSLETLRMVMALCRTHTVYPVMGNVDLWRWEFLQSDDPAQWREMRDFSMKAMGWWGGSLLHDLCAELGVTLTAETDMTAVFPEIQRRFAPEMRFIEQMPTILETQRMIFAHAGIPHERLEELEGTDAFPIVKFDDFYHTELRFQKYVVVGHWPTVLYSKTYPKYEPIIDRDRRIVCVDGACGIKREGQLNLLILPDADSEDFSFLCWNDLPVITALDAQEPSPPEEARYIPWSDHSVELIQRGEEMSRVLYHGKPMDVPTQFIFHHHGVLSCLDTTDYTLPVSPGDQLYLILKLNYGCFVKKDSVSGWYFGRYQTNEVIAP